MKYQALILAGAAAVPFVSASAVPTRAALQKRVFPTGSADAAAFFSTVDPSRLEHLFSLANAGNAGFISHAQSFTSANAEQYSSYLAAKNIDPSEASAILGGIATRSADASGAQATGDGSSSGDGSSTGTGEGNSSDSGSSASASGSDGAASGSASATDGASSATDGASSGAAGASSTGASAASSAASGASGTLTSATGAAASGTNGSGNGNGAASLNGVSGLTNAGLVAIAGVIAGFAFV